MLGFFVASDTSCYLIEPSHMCTYVHRLHIYTILKVKPFSIQLVLIQPRQLYKLVIVNIAFLLNLPLVHNHDKCVPVLFGVFWHYNRFYFQFINLSSSLMASVVFIRVWRLWALN